VDDVLDGVGVVVDEHVEDGAHVAGERLAGLLPAADAGAGVLVGDVEHRRRGVEEDHDARQAGGADRGDDVLLDVGDDLLEGHDEGGVVDGVDRQVGAAGHRQLVGEGLALRLADGDDVGGDALVGEEVGRR
jgi:hypothetical protein